MPERIPSIGKAGDSEVKEAESDGFFPQTESKAGAPKSDLTVYNRGCMTRLIAESPFVRDFFDPQFSASSEA